MLALSFRFGLIAALSLVLSVPGFAQQKPKAKPATTTPPADDGWGSWDAPAPAPKPKPKTTAKPAAKTATKPATKPATKTAAKPAATDETAKPATAADEAAKPAESSDWGAGDPEPAPAAAKSGTGPGGKKKPVNFYKLSTDPAVFPDDARKLLDRLGKDNVTETAMMFQSTWSAGRFSPPQQQRVIAIAQQMVERRYKAHPHYEQYFGSLVSAVNEQALSGSALDDLLTVFEKTLANDPPTAMPRLLSVVSQVLAKRTLYQGRTNSLKFGGGKFAFQYYDGGNPAPAFGKPYEAPKPEAPPEPKKVEPAPVTKAAPKPAAKKKAKPKPANDGWGDPEPAAAAADDGWGSWDTPAPKKKTTAKAKPKPADPPPPPPGWGDEPVILDGAAGGGWGDDPALGGGQSQMMTYAPEPMPVVSGAVLVIKDVDLIIGTSSDSTGGAVVKGATGAVMLTKGVFVGNGGTMSWEPTPGNPATATLNQYTFDVSKPGFKAEGATLDYPSVLEKPIDGVLDYRAARRDKQGRSSYPRFASFTNNARIKNLGDGIAYHGGFALAGAKLSTASLDGSLSTILLSANDSLRMRAQSGAFQLGDSLITAARAGVTLHQHGTDSIIHPGVKFKYAIGKHMATLVRGDGIYRQAPYFDSYHQMEIGAELVTWDIRSPYVNFAMITAKNQVFATFASKEFYTDTYYQQQKTIARFHPLQLVYAYSLEKKSDQFFLIDLVEARKLSKESLHKAVLGLARDGFVDYNPASGSITIKQKAKHYVQSAKGKKDYDHILVNSLSSAGKNATLDLQKNELLVRGVERFNFLADTVECYMEPDSGIVRIQKNRNMKFSGRLTATDLAFVGSDFVFDYEGFYVDMAQIDSTIVRDKKKKVEGGKAATMALTSPGKKSSGRLYLNRPDNKSGRRKLGKFPSFDSQSGAYVFFNDPAIQGGVYDTTVFFEVPPFHLDSLNGSAKAPVGLKGTFHSGGIFPDIQTELSLQPDGSSGFTYKVPPEGIAAYGGKGTLFNTVKMDNGGLQGSGSLKVKEATLKSDQIVFYVDSAVAVGQSVAIPGSANAPKLAGSDYLMKWYAQRDSLTMTTQQEPFKLYDKGDYAFSGTAIVTPRGLGGSGTLDHATASIAGEDLTFKKDSYDGHHAMLIIKGPDEKKPALKAKDANVHYDIAGGFAEFAPEKEGAATTELAGIQYRTSLPGGRWDFKKKRVTLKVPDGAGLAKSYFVSTKPDQQSLRFPAAGGVYDLEKLQLRATGVPYITVGDARVQPDSMRVVIAENAVMQPFKKAIITMDTLTKFHRLYDGEIQIQSRTRFTGSASYRYANRGDTATIRFNDFRIDSASVLLHEKAVAAADVDPLADPDAAGATVDKKAEKAAAKAAKEAKKKRELAAANAAATGNMGGAPSGGLVTRARATVGDKEQVFVAPRVQYRGGMAIISRKRGFSNEGEGRLKLSKDVSASDWFALNDSIDPANVRIPIGGLRASDGSPMFTGIMRSDGTSKLYPLYVGVKQDPADLPVFEVGDVLTYNKSKDEFMMGNEKRDGFEVNEGNVMTWNGKNGGATMRGKFNFINNNPNFKMEAAGFGTGIPDSGVYEVNVMITIDTKLPGKSTGTMASNMAKSSEGAMRAVQLGDEFTSKLGDFVGSKPAKAFNQVKPGGAPDPLPRFNPKFDRTLVLNDVTLKWSRKNRAWYSTGAISVSNAGQGNINAVMEGYLEIKRAPEGDYVELLLEPDPSTSYHFKYANGTLLAFSSWEAFANEIIEKQPKEEYLTASQFGVWPGDEFQKDQFRGWFLKQYRSEEDRRKLKRKVSSAPAFTPETAPADGASADGTSKKKKKKDDEATPPADNGAFSPSPGDTAPADGATEATAKKKKKKSEDTPAADAPPADAGNSNFAPSPGDAPADAAADTAKKKKKKKEEETPPADAPAAEPAANPNFAPSPTDAAPTDAAADTGKKKKKKKEEEAPPADAPAPEPVNPNFAPSEGDAPADGGGKKKKKKKDDNASEGAFGEPTTP